MQTHKNPNLRSGPAPFKATAGTATNYSGKPAVEKSPVFQRDGKKWIIVRWIDLQLNWSENICEHLYFVLGILQR